MIVGNAKIIIAFFVLLTIATTAVWTTSLVPDTRRFSFFDEDHFWNQVVNVNKEKFSYESEGGKMQLYLAFGLKSADPWYDGGVFPPDITQGAPLAILSYLAPASLRRGSTVMIHFQSTAVRLLLVVTMAS